MYLFILHWCTLLVKCNLLRTRLNIFCHELWAPKGTAHIFCIKLLWSLSAKINLLLQNCKRCLNLSSISLHTFKKISENQWTSDQWTTQEVAFLRAFCMTECLQVAILLFIFWQFWKTMAANIVMEWCF